MLNKHLDLSAAKKVLAAFRGQVPNGIFGLVQSMPEKEMVKGIPGQLDRVILITMTVAIDYQRDATRLWQWARELYNESATRWVFSPSNVSQASKADLESALKAKPGGIRYPHKDVAWWHENAKILSEKYQGDPLKIFELVSWDVLRIAEAVRRLDRFRGLGGEKIFPLWLRMLRDIEGLPFRGMDNLPIPVDRHIARATFTTGLLKGNYSGKFNAELIKLIQDTWREVCATGDTIPIDFDEALWQLSRQGCHYRHQVNIQIARNGQIVRLGMYVPLG